MKLLNISEFFGFSIEVYIICIIISVPTFFFWRWLLRKLVKVGNTRQVLTWLATIIATPIIYSGLIYLFILWISYEPTKKFDSFLWQKDKESRYQMADNIVESKILINKDTIQLKEVLGEPAYRDSAAKRWSYNIGMGGGGLGFMFHELTITFNAKKVISVEHIKIRD
jgi:hypothetical protein